MIIFKSKNQDETLEAKCIESIDLLRGLVMILMGLDHTRDYFHLAALIQLPYKLLKTVGLIIVAGQNLLDGINKKY